MEVIILGSGTSTGVPLVGVEYPETFLKNPKNHRLRSSVLLRGPEGNVLVDSTPDMRQQLLKEEVMDLEAIIITHTHADHIMGLDDVRPFCIFKRKSMPIYASRDSQEDIRRIFSYAFQKKLPGTHIPQLELQNMPKRLEIAGLAIQSLWVRHGEMPVMSLRIGSFAYVTDVSEIPMTAWSQLQGLSVLVLDAVRYAPHPTHFHYEKSIEIAKKLGAKKTYFTHLSDDYDHDKVNADLPEGMELAYDGLRISLDSSPNLN